MLEIELVVELRFRTRDVSADPELEVILLVTVNSEWDSVVLAVAVDVDVVNQM